MHVYVQYYVCLFVWFCLYVGAFERLTECDANLEVLVGKVSCAVSFASEMEDWWNQWANLQFTLWRPAWSFLCRIWRNCFQQFWIDLKTEGTAVQNSQVVQDHKEKDKCLSVLGERDMVGWLMNGRGQGTTIWFHPTVHGGLCILNYRMKRLYFGCRSYHPCQGPAW